MNTEAYFKDLHAKHGNTVQALGWGSEESQRQRFEALLRKIEEPFAGILDVGCGHGGLLDEDYCEFFYYTGIDLMPEFIEEARRRHPKATFILDDFLTHDFGNQKFDYVFGSGIFSLKRDDWQENVFRVVSKMFHLCNIGVGVNFLSAYSKCENPKAAYVHPSSMMNLFSGIIHKMMVDCSYRENDFTVFLFR